MAPRKPQPTRPSVEPDQKVIVLPALKPRNAVQRAALQKKAGEHGPSTKAQRKRANDALKKTLPGEPSE